VKTNGIYAEDVVKGLFLNSLLPSLEKKGKGELRRKGMYPSFRRKWVVEELPLFWLTTKKERTHKE